MPIPSDKGSFDCASTSLREVLAPLRMTAWCFCLTVDLNWVYEEPLR